MECISNVCCMRDCLEPSIMPSLRQRLVVVLEETIEEHDEDGNRGQDDDDTVPEHKLRLDATTPDPLRGEETARGRRCASGLPQAPATGADARALEAALQGLQVSKVFRCRFLDLWIHRALFDAARHMLPALVIESLCPDVRLLQRTFLRKGFAIDTLERVDDVECGIPVVPTDATKGECWNPHGRQKDQWVEPR